MDNNDNDNNRHLDKLRRDLHLMAINKHLPKVRQDPYRLVRIKKHLPILQEGSRSRVTNDHLQKV